MTRSPGMAIVARFNEMVKEKGISSNSIGIRVVASKALGRNTVRVIVSSAGKLDLPSVKNFIFNASNYTLIPFNDSYLESNTDSNSFASIHCTFSRVCHLREDDPRATRIVQLSANTYLDQEIGTVWQKKNIENVNYFVRSSEDDVEKILTEMNANYPANIKASMEDFIPSMAVGNVISFFAHTDKGSSIEQGIIASIDSAKQAIKVKSNNHFYTIPLLAVHRVVALAAGDIPEDVINYLKQAYNPKDGSFDYAEMFKKN